MNIGPAFSLQRIIGQLVRYGFVGVAINLVLYLLYLVLTKLGSEPLLAATMCFLLGVPVSLIAYGRIIFKINQVSMARRFVFAFGYLVGYGMQIGGLYLLYMIIGLPHQFAQLAMMVIVALFLFCVQKFLVFRS